MRRRLDASPDGQRLRRAWADEYDKVGFPFIPRQIVDTTKPEDVLAMLRDLGSNLRRPTQITVGGSASLILTHLLDRLTQDVDVVNELPEAIRTDHALIDRLDRDYKLRLAHFASHYLPSGYAQRTRSLGTFGRVEVILVDPVDVLTGKVFSRRPKDLVDLRAAWQNVDRDALRERVRTATDGLRQTPNLLEKATQNWYILTGEEALP